MRLFLFLWILCSTFGVTTLYPAASPPPQCAPFAPPAIQGPLTQPAAKKGIVLINEVMPSSNHTWDCSEIGTAKQNHQVWIELYNPQNRALALFSAVNNFDGGPGTQPTLLPFGASIPAHGFLVIFPETSGFFSMTETCTLRLLFSRVLIDQVNLCPLPAINQSYARIPDGSPNWQIASTPTIDSSNTQISATPTHIPKQKATKGSRTGTTNRRFTNTGTSSSTDGTTNDATAPTAIGTQPAWSGLQLPSGNRSSPEATTPADTSSTNTTAISSSNDTTDIQRKVVFTSLTVVLVGILLFLGWRRFKRAKPI